MPRVAVTTTPLSDSELAHLALMHIARYGFHTHTVKCVHCGDTFDTEGMVITRHDEIWCAWCLASNK